MHVMAQPNYIEMTNGSITIIIRSEDDTSGEKIATAIFRLLMEEKGVTFPRAQKDRNVHSLARKLRGEE